MKKSEKQRNRGITLIALVITIIVLLILAGVTIATLTGENGILTRAKTAKEETEKAETTEELNMYRTELNMNKVLADGADSINVEGYEELKKYIPSITEKDANSLKIENGELVFKQSATDAQKDVFLENDISPETVEAPVEWFSFDGGKLVGFSDEIVSNINEISDKMNTAYDEIYDGIDNEIRKTHSDWYDEEGNLKQEVFENSQTYEEYMALYKSLSENIEQKLEEIDEEYDKELIKMGITRMKLPNQSTDGITITEIGSNAFDGYQRNSNLLEKIILPENLQAIGTRAFISQNLKTIEIPSEVTLIEAGAFSANPLEEIIFRGNIPTLGYEVSYGAFSGYNLQRVQVPSEYLESYKNYTGWGFENATDYLDELLEGY